MGPPFPFVEYLGIFSPQGDLYLFEDDVQKAIKTFALFIQNRLLKEGDKHLDRKVDYSKRQLYKF